MPIYTIRDTATLRIFSLSPQVVGAITQRTDGTVTTYTTMNGVSDAADAPVVGDYMVSMTYDTSGIPYALTARVAGEVVLDIRGVTGFSDTDDYIVTVTEYAESDCEIANIGQSKVCARHQCGKDPPPPYRSRVQFSLMLSASSRSPVVIEL